jgi:chromosome segregation ATPase
MSTTTVEQDAAYWRQLAQETAERLKIADTQNRDVREAADEARARLMKYKQRLENAQERVNELQLKLIEVSAERDALRDGTVDRERVKRLVYEYRQSLLEGPIFELFAEFCRDVAPEAADEGASS